MTPKADFPFASQQHATFYYLNVNPQFQGFNNGNWRQLEDSIRNRSEKAFVTTRVDNILALPNDRNILKNLYLTNRKLPIPLIFTKQVTFPLNETRIYKFIGFNYPTIRDLDQGFKNDYFNANYSIGIDCFQQNTWLYQNIRTSMSDPTKGLFMCTNNLS
jgi:DNA/RNA endonuclease G (NUC1)